MLFNTPLWGFLAVFAVCHALGPEPRGAEDWSLTLETDRIRSTRFDHFGTDSSLDLVSNSGVCETTRNVKQYSGYLNVGPNMNMWFWFFEARHDPKNAPTAAWFNGGPGCSSMIGLFSENGPCTFNNGEPLDRPSINKYSFNEYANMLYIDQPISVGFSRGTDNVNSTKAAAPLIWNLLQAFYVKFPEYSSRDFGIFTESYGGHYGPAFAKYILDQNDAIDAGKRKGQKINMVALGLNNAWVNPYDAYKGMIDFATENSHKVLMTKDAGKTLMNTLNQRCLPALKECWSSGTNAKCAYATNLCKGSIESRIMMRNSFDVYDVRRNPRTTAMFPPKTYQKFLRQPFIQTTIGAGKAFNECPSSVQIKFQRTGDDSKNYHSTLEQLVNKNVSVLIWAGDADWICNWKGNLYTADAVRYPGHDEFKSKKLAKFSLNGKARGEYKTVKNLSFLRVYNAGHTVMAYQPDVALHVFKQTMQRRPISPA